MEFINFLRDEPVMGWFAFLALLVTVVPAASVLWRKVFKHNQTEAAKQSEHETKSTEPAASVLWPKVFKRNQTEAAKQSEHETKSTHFGNQTELLILFIGIALLLIVIVWIRSAFFG